MVTADSLFFSVVLETINPSTVYDLFIKAIEQYGLPSRIRCDQGRENIHVARHMLRHRGEERNSVLVGSSVHNQCIERLWRDMHRCTTSMYYRLLYYLEYHDLLNPIDDVHIFSLHYIFIPVGCLVLVAVIAATSG